MKNKAFESLSPRKVPPPIKSLPGHLLDCKVVGAKEF
jgi:hypothetical protein